MTWTIIQTLLPATSVTNQPGYPIDGWNVPVAVPAVPNLLVEARALVFGYADTAIFAYSTDDGQTWQTVTADQILPPSELSTLGGLDLQFTDPFLPQIYVMPQTSGRLFGYVVGTYSNGQWTWTWQKVRWDDRWLSNPFDPKWPGVVYSDTVALDYASQPVSNTNRRHLSLSTDSGGTWYAIPTMPMLQGDYFVIQTISRDAVRPGTDLWVTSWNASTKTDGPSAEVFVPDATIQNPSLMLTPVELSLKIGSSELVITKSGTKTTVALDAKPIVLDGRTMLPIRPIVEALGGTISYSDGVVSIAQGGHSVTLRIGNNMAVVNGQDVQIDQNPSVKPFIVPPGRTMLPLRFVAEALGAQVTYLGGGNISVVYPNPGQQ